MRQPYSCDAAALYRIVPDNATVRPSFSNSHHHLENPLLFPDVFTPRLVFLPFLIAYFTQQSRRVFPRSSGEDEDIIHLSQFVNGFDGARHRIHFTEQSRDLIQPIFVTRPLCPVLVLGLLSIRSSPDWKSTSTLSMSKNSRFFIMYLVFN